MNLIYWMSSKIWRIDRMWDELNEFDFIFWWKVSCDDLNDLWYIWLLVLFCVGVEVLVVDRFFCEKLSRRGGSYLFEEIKFIYIYYIY